MSLKKTPKEDDLDLGKGSPRGKCPVQGIQVGPVTGTEPCASAPTSQVRSCCPVASGVMHFQDETSTLVVTPSKLHAKRDFSGPWGFIQRATMHSHSPQ